MVFRAVGRRRRRLHTGASVFVFAILASTAGPVRADDDIRDRGIVRWAFPRDLDVGVDARRGERLRATIVERARDLGLDAAIADGITLEIGDTLTLRRSPLDIIEIVGRYGEIPLLLSVAKVVVDRRDGKVLFLTTNGRVGPRIDTIRPLLEAHDALHAVENSGLPGSRGATSAKLVVAAGREFSRPAWLIDPPLDRVHLTNPSFLVDAHDGEIRSVRDRVRTALVRSFRRNPYLDPAEDYAVHHLDSRASHLSGPFFVANNCLEPSLGDWCDPAPTATADGQGNFFYPVPNIGIHADNIQPFDAFAEASIYYHADKFLAWLTEFGFSGLMCNRAGARANLVANFKTYSGSQWEPFDNAFFSGDCDQTLVFGQGSYVDFSYDGDVVYHELGHGVVEAQMNGGFLGASRHRADALVQDAGAINEAVADFLSSSFAEDPAVGDYVGQVWLDAPGVRVNDNSFRCPESLVGEVHIDSEAYAGALWQAFQSLGPPVVEVVLDTIASLAEDATFEEAARATIEITGAILGSDARLHMLEIMASRGLLACHRSITPDKLRTSLYVQPGLNQFSPWAPPPMQLVFQVPVTADTMDLHFSTDVYSGPFGGKGKVTPGVVVRSGGPLVFDYDETKSPIQVSTNADSIVVDVSGGHVQLAVIPGANVFVGFVNTGDAIMKVKDISAEMSYRGTTGDTDDGGGDGGSATDASSSGSATDTLGDSAGDDSQKAGCSCRQTRHSWQPATLLLMVLGLFAPGRRRARL